MAEEKKERSGAKDFLLGAFVGALTGSVVALLLAPKTGTELRKSLTEQFQQVREKGEQLKQTLIDEGQLKEYAEEAKHKLSKSVEKVQNLNVNIEEKARQKITDIASEIDEKMEELSANK